MAMVELHRDRDHDPDMISIPSLAAADRELAARAVQCFPGLIAVVSPCGKIDAAWSNLAAVDATGAPGKSLQELLRLADDSSVSVMLQIWMACVNGTDGDGWQLYRNDAPRCVDLHDGARLELEYAPVFTKGEVTQVIVYARETELVEAPAESPSPVQVGDGGFCAEARGLIAECRSAVDRLSIDPHARHAIHAILRAVHTIKGNARALGLTELTSTAHLFEDVLVSVRDSGPCGRADVEQIRRIVEDLDELIGASAPTRSASPHSWDELLSAFHDEARQLLSAMRHAFERWSARLRDRKPLQVLHELSGVYALSAHRYSLYALAAHADELGGLVAHATASGRPNRSMAARIERHLAEMDEHLRLYQAFALEIFSTRDGAAFVDRAIQTVNEALPPLDDSFRTLAAEAERIGIPSVRAVLASAGDGAVAQLERLFNDAAWFAGTAAGDRLPMLSLARQLHDVARDLSEGLGKAVGLQFAGNSPTTDPMTLQRIQEMLIHAVSNAIDHGLEPPGDRIAAGKPAAGQICIMLSEEDERLVIAVTDDGRGVNRDQVLSLAIERGLVDRPYATCMSDAEIDALVFEPGLTTNAATSTISGRGVGMDAIKATAEKLGGCAAIRSEPGCGTTLQIVLPAPAPAS